MCSYKFTSRVEIWLELDLVTDNAPFTEAATPIVKSGWALQSKDALK